MTDETTSSNRGRGARRTPLYRIMHRSLRPTRGEKTADHILQYAIVKGGTKVAVVGYILLVLSLVPVLVMGNPRGAKISTGLFITALLATTVEI